MKLVSTRDGALTPRQRAVLDVISRHLRVSGRSPTYEAIGRALGVCKITAYEHVFHLKSKGYLSADRKVVEPSRVDDRVTSGIRDAIQALESFELKKAERILKSLLPPGYRTDMED